MNEVRDLIIKEELIGEIKRLAEENQLYAENEVRFVKKILALNNKVANLHKVISKLQTKVARQKENITTLLHLYTSGKRSKSHKKLREKYRALRARIAELEAESERFTAHDATERQDDKLPEREVCEACGGDGTLLLVDNYKGQATATVDCPYCNGTGRVNKECEE